MPTDVPPAPACCNLCATDGQPMRGCKIEGHTTSAERSRLVREFERGTYQVWRKLQGCTAHLE